MNYILTFDYELFGDGSGDLFSDVINPMQEILNICDAKEVKIKIFFEILEYLEIKKEWEKGNKMGYKDDPIIAMENQILNAYKNGHDIQLHIHPQWVDCKYEDGFWKLDMDNWRLGDYVTKNEVTLEVLLHLGKETLEKLIQRIDQGYSCIALRAGGYNIMPSDNVFKAMQKVGLLVDSSIFPGGNEDSNLSKFDYTKVPDTYDYWYADKSDLRLKSNNSNVILEMPIFALPILRIKKLLNINQIISRFIRKGTKMSANTHAKFKINKFSIIKYFFTKEAYTWDTTVFSENMHNSFFKYIKNNLKNKREHFVLIGHPKSLIKASVFILFFKSLNNYDFAPKYLTITGFYNKIKRSKRLINNSKDE